jgi:hypothetical protein
MEGSEKIVDDRRRIQASLQAPISCYFGGRRFNEIYLDKRLAQAALHALRPGVFPQGAQGAGRMAMQGSYLGCNAHSGQGGAFRQIGVTKIAADGRFATRIVFTGDPAGKVTGSILDPGRWPARLSQGLSETQ